MYHSNQPQYMPNMQMIPTPQQPHTPLQSMQDVSPNLQLDDNQRGDEAPLKLKKLDEIHSLILKSLHGIIQMFDELSKDKQTLTKVKTSISEYVDNLKRIESELLQEINYLGLASTGHPHEGSIYGAKKDYDLAKQRLFLVTSQFHALNQALNSPSLKQESN
jgi:hypothetical protein